MLTTVSANRTASLRRRTFVRLFVFFSVLLAGDIGAQVVRVFVSRSVPRDLRDGLLIGAALVLGAMLVGLYFALVWGMERRKARELAPGAREALLGIIVGCALFAIVFGVLEMMGVARWRGFSPHFDVVPTLAAALIAAIGEELTFRGGLFRVLDDGFGTAMALLVSALIFGLLHAMNPSATVVSTAAIALEAGVLLGAAYAFSGNLWLPIGIHLGWNFTEGGLFGVSVSGFKAGNGLFSVALAGPTLLTGGRFGPEASIVAVVVCVVAALVFITRAIRKGRWKTLRANFVLE